MKKYAALLTVSILIGLALTFSQVFAAVPESAAMKKTPPSQESLRGKPTAKVMKATKISEKETRLATLKSDRPEKPSKTPKPRIGKPVNFRGTIVGINAGSIELALKKGGSQAIEMDGETHIHIPTMGYVDDVDGLTTGMEVSVHAVVMGEDKHPLAKTILVIPAKPSHLHKPVIVESYTAGASITVTAADGSQATFDISGARILPDPNAIVQPGDKVTLVFSRKGDSLTGTVIAIVIHRSPK